MGARADLHVHSRYSDQADSWWLRKISAPESFTEPLEVYRQCRAQGMDFVTISDHNTIEGARAIAHLPGTFLSSEITVSFPEDDCRIHCLVLGVSEAQFRQIDRLRGDIYAFRDYLYDEDIPHSVAHALYRVNDRLTVQHFERLLVLFKNFEVINGARDPRAGNLVRTVLQSLTPNLMAELVERHRLDPRDDKPWEKHLTAGSDDHAGLYIARAYTETPAAETVEEFLDHLRHGRHRPAGEAGSSLHLARCFADLSRKFIRRRLQEGDTSRRDPLTDALDRILDSRDSGRTPAISLGLRWAAAKVLPFSATTAQTALLATRFEASEIIGTAEEQAMERAARQAHIHLATAARHIFSSLATGRLATALEGIAPAGTALMTLAPWLTAFHAQHKDEATLQAVARRFPAARRLVQRSDKKAWFTDTLTEINGVARTLADTARAAVRQQRSLTLVTCGSDDRPGEKPPEDLPVWNFAPVTRLPIPEYDELEVRIPSLLEVIERCEREQVSEIIISTPGPVGIAGLVAGKLLGLPVTGIYHTDFPRYVKNFTGSADLEEKTWLAMRWFWNRMDYLLTPSACTLDDLVSHGVEAPHMAVMRRGIDRELFHPGRRRGDYWQRHGLSRGTTLLYVGRLSKEKNLDLLLKTFERLVRLDPTLRLALVGDGPHREALAEGHRDRRIAFTGVLHGEDLAAAYASADLFVFPSETDTFGNAVLEAQACGLPAIVSDRGGPREILGDGEDIPGAIVSTANEDAFATAILELAARPERRAELSKLALQQSEHYRWEALVDQLWREPIEPETFPQPEAASAEPHDTPAPSSILRAS